MGEEKAISPEVLSTISRGYYSKTDMERMEWTMLQALQWRVNVPTPLAFVREYLSTTALLPQPLDPLTKDRLLSLVSVQTELCATDYNFVTIKPSSIGFAALVNAMEVMGLDVATPHYSMVVPLMGLIDTEEVFRIQSTLYRAVANM